MALLLIGRVVSGNMVSVDLKYVSCRRPNATVYFEGRI